MKTSTAYSAIRALLVWGGLFLFLYFAEDIVDKGKSLNEWTPFPFLGYCLWGSLIGIIWFWFIWPIISFCRLESFFQTSKRSRLQTAYRQLRKQKDLTEKEEQLRSDIYNALYNPNGDSTEENFSKLLEQYRECAIIPQKARELILSYGKSSAIAVVISRNNWLDGLILLVLQMKLIVELARLHGYRPSPVFNTLCFGWVLTNSLLNALLAQQAVDAAGDAAVYCTELILEDESPNAFAETISAIPYAGAAASGIARIMTSILVEGVLAGATVYVSGRIFLRKLEGEMSNTGSGESKSLTLKEYVKIRREGRTQLAKAFISNKAITDGAMKAAKSIAASIPVLPGKWFGANDTPAGGAGTGAESNEVVGA